MLDGLDILAQGDFDLGDWFYVIIVGLSMLGGFGKWIRERSGKVPKDSPVQDARGAKKPRREAPRRPSTPAKPIKRAARQVSEPTALDGPRRKMESPEPVPTATLISKPAVARPVARPQRETRRRPATARPVRPDPATVRPTPKRSRQDEIRALMRTMEHRPDAARPQSAPTSCDFSALSLSELRRAIVLAEVLGPPIALRAYGESVIRGA